MKKSSKSKPTNPDKPPHVPKIEILTVWSEYLKRSDRYKEFVAAVRKYGELPEFVTGTLTKFKKNYERFGDVFDKGFSVKAIADRFDFEDKDNAFDEKQYLNLFIETLKNELDRAPTVKDLIKLLTQDLERSSLLFLIIDIRGRTDEELKAAFMGKAKERRESLGIPRKPKAIRFNRPTTDYWRKDLTGLKGYLKIYDRHKAGESLYQIAGKLSGEEDRGTYLDYEKAKRIIKNVENGFFPGKY